MSFVEEFQRCWLTALIGCIMFIGGTGILFFNEGRAVHISQSLDEALSEAISISVNPGEAINKDFYEGKLIHVTGELTTNEPLTETDYNIQVQAVKLRRRVQMYQWVEETVENNFGDSVTPHHTADRTYYYVKEWSEKLIDSQGFYIPGHNNPKSFPIQSKTQIATNAFLSNYEIGENVKDRMENYIDVTSDTRPEDPSVKMHFGFYYHCEDIFNPEIGDVRLRFQFAGLEGDVYTVVGKIDNGKVVPYSTKFARNVLLLQKGKLSLLQIFKDEHHSVRKSTWGFRFFGWMLLFMGATCTTTLTHYVFSRNRILCRISPDIHFPVSGNIIISLSLGLIISAIAWGFHRPLLGLSLLVAALSPFLIFAKTVIHYQRVAN